MIFFRRLIGHVALACLLGQLATSVVVPAVVLALAESASECTCSHGDHATCPMHHRSSGRCGMRSAPDFAVVLIPALFGFTGVMPAADAPVQILAARTAFDRVTAAPILRTAPPDVRPPQA
jgi:hypothetical protein